MEKRNLWIADDNYTQNINQENISEGVLNQINSLINEENERMKTINNLFNQNKIKHINKLCCNLYINQTKEEIVKDNNFLSICLDIDSHIKQLKLEIGIIKLNGEFFILNFYETKLK